MSIRIVAALVCVVILAIFAYQNVIPVQLTFVYWISPEVPLWSVVLAAALAGAVVMYLLDTVRVFRASRNLRQEAKKSKNYRKQIKDLKAELESHKGKKKSRPETSSPGESEGRDDTRPDSDQE